MPQAKTEVALQFSESCAAEVALQHSLFWSAEVVSTQSCAAASEKLHCNIEKATLRKVALSCRFPVDFKLPRLGPHVQDLLIKIAQSVVIGLPGYRAPFPKMFKVRQK